MRRFYTDLTSKFSFLSKMNVKVSDVNGVNNSHYASFAKLSKEAKVLSCLDGAAVEIASDRLHKGDVIALPTDTVYGLACSANDPNAIQKLYEIKGRDGEKPVAVCVSSIAQLKHFSEASHLPDALLMRLLPGAVTIVLNKSIHLDNPFLNPGIQKIGLRIPDSEFIQQVSRAFVAPIALTSANKSGACSTLDVYEFRDLWPDLAVVFNGGHLGDVLNDMKQRSASTVVDLSRPGFYEIIRNGMAMEETMSVLNDFNIQKC